MKVIGLTGGIASGKSTISALFQKRGVVVLDADINSREVVEPGQPALSEIAAAFGEDLILPGGGLDREKLGDIIFSDTSAREQLNAIVHPRVAHRFFEQVQAHQPTEAWLIYDAPLIVENNLQSGFDGLIVVRCEPDIQKSRLMRRNSLNETEANNRIRSQFPLDKKVEVADWIIDNSGTLEESEDQVNALFDSLCLKFGKPSREETNE